MTTFIARVLDNEKSTLAFLGGDIYFNDIKRVFEALNVKLSPHITGLTGRPGDIFKAFAKLLLKEGIIKAMTYRKRRCSRYRVETCRMKRRK